MADERKVQFIETAMKLFAEKGYYSTSIQDIVDAWGISKGAFYHHFSSKEDLMLAIIQHHFEKMLASITAIPQDSGSEKERFIQQIAAHFANMHEHKDFLQMMITEQLPKISRDIHLYLLKQQTYIFSWYCARLIEVYGTEIERYVFDVATMLNGMIRQYMFCFFLQANKLHAEELARFLVRRLDAIVASFSHDEAPILNKEILKPLIEMEEKEWRVLQEKISAHIAHMQKKILSLSLDKKIQHEIYAALDALEAELMNEESAPREYVVQGILLYIEKQHIPSLADDLASLTEVVQQYMTTNRWERRKWKKEMN
ncbi:MULTISPECIES: TetR/AcrR family transcriptional regulator [Parageobacillus]|jgi:TetR/AcrR family transcriptional regulator, cholesterol catabolism regulator|uniref:TetR family transcriptional regulator n=1 Tax=Parageobacillus thermoglucosidasius TaxID=1426 RepID=A0A1B7KQV6_PARTM|nr:MULTISPECIES: TetR/AcrR family transcriptional regulator [Parageobacillus]OAT72476.1 TetR family transcriptional regulator [Parageobacillus thermoglucosidasius]BDG45692.1 TetR family transcriptional regulator [Parageobacillus sp. KH3-4]